MKKASFVNKGIGKIGLQLLLLFVGCVTWFQLILVHFELLQILVQPEDLKVTSDILCHKAALDA